MDFLVDSILSMLEDLTHDIWNKEVKEAGRSQINHITYKPMTSLKWKLAQSSAIWRIQYHKNLITYKNVPRKRTAPISCCNIARTSTQKHLAAVIKVAGGKLRLAPIFE